MRMPGVICMTRSLSRVAPPTKTLSVYVSRSVMSGVTVQRAAAGWAASIRIGRAASLALRTLRSIAVAVIAVDPRVRRLVEQGMDDRTGFEHGERRIECRVSGVLRFDH